MPPPRTPWCVATARPASRSTAPPLADGARCVEAMVSSPTRCPFCPTSPPIARRSWGALRADDRGRALQGLFDGEVLDLSAEEAAHVFSAHPKIVAALRTMCELGIGYLHLGQGSHTLSGGEAQRLKLANELTAGSRHEPTLYVLDEPTTGLHLADVARLITVLERLVDRGDTLVIIEHHPVVIASADHVISSDQKVVSKAAGSWPLARRERLRRERRPPAAFSPSSRQEPPVGAYPQHGEIPARRRWRLACGSDDLFPPHRYRGQRLRIHFHGWRGALS